MALGREQSARFGAPASPDVVLRVGVFVEEIFEFLSHLLLDACVLRLAEQIESLVRVVRHVIKFGRPLGLAARHVDAGEPAAEPEGSYESGDVSATVARTGESGLEVALRETDPVAQTDTGWKGTASALGGGVYGLLGRTLMSQRIDFPRPGLARIGWVVLPRVAP